MKYVEKAKKNSGKDDADDNDIMLAEVENYLDF